MSVLWTVPILITTANADTNGFARVKLAGMSCVSCEQKVIKSLDALPFIESTQASTALQTACVELTSELNTAAITGAIEDLGYTMTSVTIVEECELRSGGLLKNWDQTDGLDVQIISTGEEVNLEDFLAPDKFTIYDFGAPWCAPCHASETLLKAYMAEHPSVAVRAIVLDSSDPKISFSMPATKQHLQSAAGLPYFLVMNPKGKTIYRGTEIDKLLKKLDKHL
ncbi:MAG: cation transporter [Myxococcota bacterium]